MQYKKLKNNNKKINHINLELLKELKRYNKTLKN